MALGERIRALRKGARWSQAELGQKIGSDGGRVSRYEAGRITPSAEALVRLAESFNVSIDHLLIGELADDDLHLVTSFIDALFTKNRLRTLAGGIR